jgi:thioredoxin 2
MIRACEACGAKNRIPAKHLSDAGRCGSCKKDLPPVGYPIEADEALFGEVILGSKVPVLVDFWAPWCGPCRMVAPEVSALASEMAGHAVVLKVDTEAHPGLASRYRIQSIPNFVVFRDGQIVFQQAGASSRAQMRRWLERVGNNA